MVASFLLSLREGLEAALIIGIVLGALNKMRRSNLNRVVWAGALGAGVISLAAALLLHAFDTSLHGRTEPIFEGVTMLLAASVLTWMIFWMRRQAGSIRTDLETGVRRATLGAGAQALFILSFLAVLREGIELALFLTASALASDARQTLGGAVLGLGAAVLLGYLLFASTIRLNLGRFFQVTGVLLILFAAGLVAHGVHEFNEAGLIPALIEHVWDAGFLVSEASFLGEALKAVFGYNPSPSLTEVLAYIGYFGVIAGSLRFLSIRQPLRQNAAAD